VANWAFRGLRAYDSRTGREVWRFQHSSGDRATHGHRPWSEIPWESRVTPPIWNDWSYTLISTYLLGPGNPTRTELCAGPGDNNLYSVPVLRWTQNR